MEPFHGESFTLLQHTLLGLILLLSVDLLVAKVQAMPGGRVRCKHVWEQFYQSEIMQGVRLPATPRLLRRGNLIKIFGSKDRSYVKNGRPRRVIGGRSTWDKSESLCQPFVAYSDGFYVDC